MVSSKHSSSKLSGAESGSLKSDEQEDEEEVARSKLTATTTTITSADQIDTAHLVGSNKTERVENNFNNYNINEEDDTDDYVDEDENEELDAFRRQEQRRRRMTNSSILSSSSAGSSRLSQQYLIHNSAFNSSISPSTITSTVTATKAKPLIQSQEPIDQYSNSNKYKMRQSNNKDDYLYSYSTEINRKKLKQIIQSKPLAVACIIIVFILFLTLSESKTLQVAQGAVQSLVMQPPPVIESNAKLVREVGDDQQQQLQQQSQQPQQQFRRRQLQLSNESSNQVEQPDARLIDQQLAFKREFINNLIQRHQTQFQPRQQRKQVSEIEQQAAIPTGQQVGVSSKHDFAPTGSGAVTGTGAFESLSAMLFGGNSASGQASRDTPTQVDEGSEQEVPIDSYIDGEPSALRSHEVADLRPASLRTSAIELDLNSDQQQQQYHTQQQSQNQNQNHQHQHQKNHNQNLNQNHIHRQQQQGNRYHQQQQAHKTNEEQHAKLQQQQLLLQQQNLGSNHDRQFDVVQVRKYSYLFLLFFFLSLQLKYLVLNTFEAIDHAS